MTDDWDVEIKPYLTPYFAYGAAALIVLFNLIADVLYSLLDPRIRYD